MAKMIGMMRLGKDAEVRFLPDGTPVTNFPVAYNYGKKQGDTRPTQWIECAFWGERGQAVAEYLKKGSLHCLTLDEVHIETYQKKDGGEGVKLVARVLDVEFGQRQESSQQQSQAPAKSQREAARDRQAAASAGKPAPNFSDLDPDIPF